MYDDADDAVHRRIAIPAFREGQPPLTVTVRPICEHPGSIGLDDPCDEPAWLALFEDRHTIAATRISADPAAPTLRELVWRTIQDLTQAAADQPTGSWTVESVRTDWRGLLAAHGPRLRAALRTTPLLDDKPLTDSDHTALRRHARRLGFEQGHQAAAAIPLDSATARAVRPLLAAGQPIYRPGFFPEPTTRALTRTYLYARMEAAEAHRDPGLAAHPDFVPMSEVYDALFYAAHARGRKAALAERLGIDPTPYHITDDGELRS